MSRKIYDLIDINWIQSAIEQINQGQKLKTILSNVQLTDGRIIPSTVSYTHLRAHETRHDLVCRLLLEKKK